MSEVPEVIQSLFDNRLDMLLPKRDPAFVGQYSISNRLVNSLAHLVGTDGVASHLVAADPFGNLRSRLVDTAGVNELKVDSLGHLSAGIWGVGGKVRTGTGPGLEMMDTCVYTSDYYGWQLYTILYDVHDAVNHALKTKEVI